MMLEKLKEQPLTIKSRFSLTNATYGFLARFKLLGKLALVSSFVTMIPNSFYLKRS